MEMKNVLELACKYDTQYHTNAMLNMIDVTLSILTTGINYALCPDRAIESCKL